MSTDRIPVETLIELFAEILEVPQIGPDANFFEFGGDSLLATRVISRIVRDYDVDLTFADFSQAPTPRDLHNLVQRLTRTAP